MMVTPLSLVMVTEPQVLGTFLQCSHQPHQEPHQPKAASQNSPSCLY